MLIYPVTVQRTHKCSNSLILEEKRIQQILNKIGFPPHLLGTQFHHWQNHLHFLSFTVKIVNIIFDSWTQLPCWRSLGYMVIEESPSQR